MVWPLPVSTGQNPLRAGCQQALNTLSYSLNMQVKVSHPSPTEAVVTVIAAESELVLLKEQALESFQGRVKVPGFREGKVPLNILEKNVDQTQLQQDFLQQAIDQLYAQALQSQKLRPVNNPEVTLKKFVPFTTLEFEAKVPVLGAIKLADYKKITKAKPVVKLTAKDVDDVIKTLQSRASEKKDVDRAAKMGDQIYIDFKGVDVKGEAVQGAEAKDYPLTLGSKQFIPGFEEELVGLKANDEKTFPLTFPKDYGVKALAGRKVTFTASVTKVQEVVEPKVDDAFAAKVGPFKTLADLKTDIKKQVGIERQQQADRAYENDLILEVAKKSTVAVPEVLIQQQIDRIEQEERQNLTYRGQTWQEHLAEEGVTEEEHRKQKHPQAEEQVKASLVLSEIAEAEGLGVTPEELDQRMQQLKEQYKDPQMQAELEKPEARRDIAGRILTEKTLEKLVSYTQK